MKFPRPEELAVRTVNQYRRREIFAYIGLRYYFENVASRKNLWAHEVATHLVENRSAKPYLNLLHFKELDTNSEPLHRILHFPGPNECFAEAALLQQCALSRKGFETSSAVYSYRLARTGRAGLFEPYFEGFKEREDAIRRACTRNPDAIVLYTDVKKFYPSIPANVCENAWKQACMEANFDPKYESLGRRLLTDHGTVARVAGSKALLTGPMFGHLIGNLVFKNIDRLLGNKLPAGYFRYVDDIVLVGSQREVDEARGLLVGELEKIGLFLHDKGKDFAVTSKTWLAGHADLPEDDWKLLIGGLKQALLTDPSSRKDIMSYFLGNSIRLPVPDYSEAIWEASYLGRLLNNSFAKWFRKKSLAATPVRLLEYCLCLRLRYTEELVQVVARCSQAEAFQRRRLVSHLRYLAGRLLYLADPKDFSTLALQLSTITELNYHAEIFRSLESGDVTKLLSLGTNAVQAAAQPLRMAGRELTCRVAPTDSAAAQGLAVMSLYGLSVDIKGTRPQSELIAFADWNHEAKFLMDSPDSFIREIACLHGIQDGRRHTDYIDRAFDTDDEIQLDALLQLEESSLSA